MPASQRARRPRYIRWIGSHLRVTHPGPSVVGYFEGSMEFTVLVLMRSEPDEGT
jgi:hypothetical protein